jgi:transposase
LGFKFNRDRPDLIEVYTFEESINSDKEWLEKGLRIFFLPSYSPQLNLIEILWRFIKDKWLEVDSYESQGKLISIRLDRRY